MNDSELKNLLLETCPVLPGQEERAWASLRSRLAPRTKRSTLGSFLVLPFWRPVAYMAFGFAVAVALFDFGAIRPARPALVFADSQAPGVYATSFYSHSAQAQVVWLNGMDPATDRPTYLDPTTPVHPSAASKQLRTPSSL
jgi:hypothetical protein